MVDAVQNYLNKSYNTNPTSNYVANSMDTGFMTAMGALLTPFRIGQEALTAGVIARMNNLDWNQAHSIAVGNRQGKEWWEDGSGKVTTLGQALYDYFGGAGSVDYTKLTKEQQDKRFSEGPAKYVSGSMDAFFSIFLDPVNFIGAGTAGAAYRLAKMGPKQFAKRTAGTALSGTMLPPPVPKGQPKLTSLTEDAIVTERTLGSATEYKRLLSKALHENGNRTASAGSQAYQNGIESIRPLFGMYPNAGFRAPKMPGKDVETAYFDTGISTYAIKGNELYSFDHAKKEWLGLNSVNLDELEKIFAPHLNNENLYKQKDFFDEVTPDAFVWEMPLVSGEKLSYVEGSHIGVFETPGGDRLTVLAVPDANNPDKIRYYSTATIPLERQPIDENLYTSRQLSTLDVEYSTWESLNFAWDKNKGYFDYAVPEYDEFGRTRISEFVPAEYFNVDEAFPTVDPDGNSITVYSDGMSPLSKSKALNRYMRGIPKTRNIEYYVMRSEKEGASPTVYEARLQNIGKKGKKSDEVLQFFELVFEDQLDGTLTIVRRPVRNPRLDKSKFDLGPDFGVLKFTNTEEALATLERLRESKDIVNSSMENVTPLSGIDDSLVAQAQAAKDAGLDYETVKQQLLQKSEEDLNIEELMQPGDSPMAAIDENNLPIGMETQRAALDDALAADANVQRARMEKPSIDLGDYGTRLVELTPSEYGSLSKARVKYKDPFGNDHTVAIPFDYILQRQPARLGGSLNGTPLFENPNALTPDERFLTVDIAGRIRPVKEVQEQINRYMQYKKTAEQVVTINSAERLNEILNVNKEIWDTVTQDPTAHLVRLVGALDRYKALIKTVDGRVVENHLKYVEEIKKIEGRIQAVFARMNPKFIEKQLDALRNDPNFIARYKSSTEYKQKGFERNKYRINALEKELTRQESILSRLNKQLENNQLAGIAKALPVGTVDRRISVPAGVKGLTEKELDSVLEEVGIVEQNIRILKDSISNVNLPVGSNASDVLEAVRAVESLKAQIERYTNTNYRNLDQYRLKEEWSSTGDPFWGRIDELQDEIEVVTKSKVDEKIQRAFEESAGRRPIDVEFGFEFAYDESSNLTVALKMRTREYNKFGDNSQLLKEDVKDIITWKFPQEKFQELREWASPKWNRNDERLFNDKKRMFPNIMSEGEQGFELNTFLKEHVGISKIRKDSPTDSRVAIMKNEDGSVSYVDKDTGEIIDGITANKIAEEYEEFYPINIQIDELDLIASPRWNSSHPLNPKAYYKRYKDEVDGAINALLKRTATSSANDLPKHEQELLGLLQYLKEYGKDANMIPDYDMNALYYEEIATQRLGGGTVIHQPSPISSFRERLIVQLINDMIKNPEWDKYAVRANIAQDISDFRQLTTRIAKDRNLLTPEIKARVLEEENVFRGQERGVAFSADVAIPDEVRDAGIQNLQRIQARSEFIASNRMLNQLEGASFPAPEELYTIAKEGPIVAFRGKFKFLSNMSDSPIKIGEEVYPTAEHAFQAAKFADPEKRAKIAAAKTASGAKALGKTLPGMRSNWNQERIKIMETIIRAKFEQNPELRNLLLATGNNQLVEGNNWGDTFWGQVNGEGRNHLGRILMKVRDELNGYRATAQAVPTASTTEVVTRAGNSNAVKEIVDAGGVYIGRNSATYNYPGFYGNPYVVSKDMPVATAVKNYEDDLIAVLSGNATSDSKIVKYYKDNFKVDVSTEEGRQRLIDRIKQIDGKKIVCAGTEPANECHGNVLVKVLEMIKSGEIK